MQPDGERRLRNLQIRKGAVDFVLQWQTRHVEREADYVAECRPPHADVSGATSV